MTTTHPLTLGTVAGVPIVADLLAKGNGVHPWDIVKVHLNANYVMANPPGFPNRPPPGQDAKKLGPLGTVVSGTTLSLHSHEAAALVAAAMNAVTGVGAPS